MNSSFPILNLITIVIIFCLQSLCFVHVAFVFIMLADRQEDSHFERDVRRILSEQGIVTKRAKEFEASPSRAKVGFAAIQEMARKQEEELMKDDLSKELQSSCQTAKHTIAKDLNFLRFDPDANCLKLESVEMAQPSLGVGKFPLEVTTPVAQSPKIGVDRKILKNR